MTAAVQDLPTEPLARPLRVVLFCGPVLERGMVRFAGLLEQNPEIEFLGGFCQSSGLGTRARLTDLVRRRGLVAAPLLITELITNAGRWLTRPGFERSLRFGFQWLHGRLQVTTDIHSADVLERIRELDADLGVIYGGPILRPELFEIPRFGTLGIHHGTLPAYRGKKTTFWALFNREPAAGVTIQRVNAGVDTGELVRYGAVPTRGRSYGCVESQLEELGLDLYMDAVVGAARGTTRARPIEGQRGRLFRDPTIAQLLRFAWRRAFEQVWPRGPSDPTSPPGVLLLTESYHPMVGGGENQARTLSASLAAAGVPVSVVTRRWDPMQPGLARVDASLVHRVGPSGRGHLKKWGLAVTALSPILAHRQTHPVLIVNGFRVLGIPATLAARCFGMKVILKADSSGEMSGTFFDAGLARFGLSHRSLPVRTLIGWRNMLLRRADVFVAISSVLGRELEDHGVDPAKICIISNGVDVERFSPANPADQERLRRTLDLPLYRKLFVYTGRLVSYKGLPRLLRVWRGLIASNPDVELVLVGEGSEDIHNCEAELHRFVEEHALGDQIRFTGMVEDVADYLRASDAFVFPTEQEAFGLAAVEAMACGLPVVSTRAGGLADFICEENGAIAVESDDELREGLQRVIDEPDLARELGRRGRETACRRFSLESIRDRYLEFILDERGEL
jgi:glycosyltransferase involved in cell wall biosynthesis/folate-dependent phosphoribosylglycinamide formyltransferase PurN